MKFIFLILWSDDVPWIIVKLEILIAENGAVIDVKIIKSSGYKILDKSGIYAARNSKFHPLNQQRKLNIEYNLRLNRW